MYTEPAYRGKGEASQIVRETTKWSEANGFCLIFAVRSDFDEPFSSSEFILRLFYQPAAEQFVNRRDRRPIYN
jgi:GNAT superfamily N-acetyltransferase